MIGIIDYGAGNIQGIKNALEYLDFSAGVVKSKDEIFDNNALILPGVGSFGGTVKLLKKLELFDSVKSFAEAGFPILGICVGMQVLFSESVENCGIKGFGFFDGKINKFDNYGSSVPEIGWNTVNITGKSRLFEGLPLEPFFYFIHLYYASEYSDFVTSTTNYNVNFASSVEYDNIFAVQFHPEKSGKNGLNLLKNFCALTVKK